MLNDVDRAKLEDLFSHKEIKAIDVLAKKLELNEVQVLRQSLRLYELIQDGLEKGRFTSSELDAVINRDELRMKQ